MLIAQSQIQLSENMLKILGMKEDKGWLKEHTQDTDHFTWQL